MAKQAEQFNIRDILFELDVPLGCRPHLASALESFKNAAIFLERTQEAKTHLELVQAENAGEKVVGAYNAIIEDMESSVDGHLDGFIEAMKAFLSCMKKGGKHLSQL